MRPGVEDSQIGETAEGGWDNHNNNIDREGVVERKQN